MRALVHFRVFAVFFILFCAPGWQPADAVQVAPPFEVFGKLPQFENAALSPSGERVALVATIGEVRRLVVLEGGKTPLLNVGVGDSKIWSIQWAGEGHLLLGTSSTVA